MKKFICFIILILYIILPFNVLADNQFISVGLTNYANINSLSIDNKNLEIGKITENNFNKYAELSVNSNIVLKATNLYTIKYASNFSNYDEALKKANDFDGYVYFDGTYNVCVGEFSSKDDANHFLESEKISKDIIYIDSSVSLYKDNKIFSIFKDSIAIKSNEGVSIKGKKYRGIINVKFKNNVLAVTNFLDIEQYLYGVVPSEMPPSWEKEALKAQSVAARNYAYSNLGLHKNDGYDVCDTIHCQVYNGIDGENDKTTNAVDETKGVMAYYNEEKINAVYFSSSGGYTDDSENVWKDKTPYLRAVKDEYEVGAKEWTREFSFEEFDKIANVGTVNEIILETSEITGRATSLKFIGSNGEKEYKKEEIRSLFSKTVGGTLDSRNFKIATGTVSLVDKYDNIKNTQNVQDNLQSNSKIVNVISKDGVNKYNINNLFVTNKSGNLLKISEVNFIDNTYKVNKIDIGNNQNYINNNIIEQNTNTKRVYSSRIKREDAKVVTFVGRGWGHGVGLSQYGANSLAKKGYKYDEILKYYYTGIEVK